MLRSGASLPVPRLDSQPLTALGPATVDDGPTILCLHSGPEAMGTVPFEVAGLKSSFAHGRLPFSLLLRPLVGLASFFLLSCSSWSLGHALSRKHLRRRKKFAQQ
jgi:hypothetical protein